jgi:hypothetical protein
MLLQARTRKKKLHRQQNLPSQPPRSNRFVDCRLYENAPSRRGIFIFVENKSNRAGQTQSQYRWHVGQMSGLSDDVTGFESCLPIASGDTQVNAFLRSCLCVKNARFEPTPCRTGVLALKQGSVHKVIHNLCG